MIRKLVGVGAEKKGKAAEIPGKQKRESASAQRGTLPIPAPTRSIPPGSGPSAPDRSNEPRPNESFGSEFLDNVAHQMVAPLQSIEMHCQNIINGNVPEDEQAMRLGEVVGHAKILSEMARRMRFLHELVSGKVLDTENLAFEKVVTIWIDGWNNYLPQFSVLNTDAQITHRRMNKLPDVIASRLAVQQVVMNLYDNALKYGRPGTSITVNATLEKPFVVNEFSHVARVKLTSAAAGRIFERGFRAEEARAVRASGTGIGMWISQRLMQAMQGDIKAHPTNDDNITRFQLFWRLY